MKSEMPRGGHRNGQTRRLTRALSLALLLLLIGSLVLAACGGDDDDDDDTTATTPVGTVAVGASTEAAASPTAGGTGGAPTAVTLGLTFIPNIQFAPFYVAIEKGYFADAGVDVTLRHHAVGEDQFGALVAGQEQLMMAAGDEVLQAVGRGVEMTYIAEVYREYPVALIVPADSDIESLEDIAGHSIGIPGEYGASWHGLLALLDSADLTRDDVTIQSVGFTQVSALVTGQVDAVMGYANNEPIQIDKAGMEVRTFPVSDALNLMSNGIVGLDTWIDANEETTRAVVAGLLRGIEFVLANPEEAVEISKAYVPTLIDDQSVSDAQEILEATLPFIAADQGDPLGSSSIGDWEATLTFLQENSLIEGTVDVDDVWSDDYLPS